MARVVVSMPAYNAGRYLSEAVRGVLAQTFTDLALLVIDDGSTDQTLAELGRVHDHRLRVLSQPNVGLIRTLNRGLQVIETDYPDAEFIARMDADDELPPDRIERQVEFLSHHPGVVACGTDYELFGTMSGVVRMPRTPAAARRRLLFGTPVAHGTAMLRASVIRELNLRYRLEFPHAEDYRFFSELAEVAELANVGMVGLRYRMHEQQVSTRRAAEQQAVHLEISAANIARITGRELSASTLARWYWAADEDGFFRRIKNGLTFVFFALRYAGWEGFRFSGRRLAENLATLWRDHQLSTLSSKTRT